MNEVVVDASVVVKWFVQEEWSEEAGALKEDYAAGKVDLIAPSVMPFEVLNALRYSGAFNEYELIEAAEALEDFQITLYGLEGNYAKETVKLAMRRGITIYDASYIALAIVRRAILWTADEKLLKKLGDISNVAHIRNYLGKR